MALIRYVSSEIQPYAAAKRFLTLETCKKEKAAVGKKSGARGLQAKKEQRLQGVGAHPAEKGAIALDKSKTGRVV